MPSFFLFVGVDWKDAVAPLSALSEIIDYLMGIYVPSKAASVFSTSVHALAEADEPTSPEIISGSCRILCLFKIDIFISLLVLETVRRLALRVESV